MNALFLEVDLDFLSQHTLLIDFFPYSLDFFVEVYVSVILIDISDKFMIFY